MSSADETALFEQRIRSLLADGAQQAAGHVRSRLTQARHAAVAQAPTSTAARISWRGPHVWMPAAGLAAAAAAVAFMLWPHGSRPSAPAGATAVATGDLDLLTDRDGLTLVEHGDGEFYEWAVYEARTQQGAGAGAGDAE